MKEKKLTRRKMLKTGLLGGLATGFLSEFARAEETKGTARDVTPDETEGPFYPIVAQADVDFDLTKVKGKKDAAYGRVIALSVTVLDTDGNPVPEASVELWQANHWGRYAHPHDPNKEAKLDPNFQGWAIVPSGKKGGLAFKTIFPGTYPATRNWTRPPHLHFKVSKRGYEELVTQMYFPGDKLNEVDRLLQRKSEAEQARMIAKQDPKDKNTFHFEIVIAEV